ncbi:WXG100 family type VII secretion target [Bacillus cereus]|nr:MULTISPECIES: WXG100 family type VII secretion target [Bacillus cereus group]MBE3642235.1 WXG100 family type VII secretion target [Bacillus anthracis]MDA1753693.1 WXG100 family type VII secretion target [Bacillus cereus]MDA2121124.1 WXG100 family type VII secretion target [Bacillus cereus]MDD0819497.1 WXG100 family type VII secretion target [Bacillus cereus]QUW33736.1 WXG100 family type VII secretion target [Bacillus cereus]
MEIKVKPEQLEQIAKNISEMQTHSQNIQQNLNQSMFSIQMQWQGATSQHFYGEYMRSMRLMESYIRNLQVTEKELRRIAQKFRQADEEYQKKQNEKLKEAHKKEKKNEKSWWEKGIEGAAEFIGVNDAIRAVTGKDPITGKELSTKERLIAAGWTLLNFVPVGKVASLAGKGIKYVASSFGKTIVKAGKRLGEGVTMVAGKAGKAAVDGIKTASHKVTEGVNFVASTAKGFADKIGSLWNKGATTVKTTFLQGNEKIQHAVKTLMEYKWIPGVGKAYVMPGVGRVSEGGQYSLKEAYQYMESKVVKGTGNREVEVPPAFRQTDFASSYESRINQTPAQINPKIEFEGIRGESLSTLKPPPDPKLKSILDEAGIKGIQYKNGVPDFSPVSKAQVEINHMVGGTGGNGSAARRLNFTQADEKLAEQLNNSPELARKFGMESGEITWKQIEKYRRAHKLTWHELNDVKTVQLVPTEINSKFGHLGGVGEINAGAFMPDGFASKQ